MPEYLLEISYEQPPIVKGIVKIKAENEKIAREEWEQAEVDWEDDWKYDIPEYKIKVIKKSNN